MKRSAVCLIFSPHCESGLNGPHLAVPQLKAFLKSENIETCSADLNIGFFRWKTQPQNLRPVLEQLIKDGDRLSSSQTVSRSELDQIVLAAEARTALQEIEGFPDEQILPNALFTAAVSLLNGDIYNVPRDFADIVAAVERGDPTPFTEYFESLDFTQITDNAPIIGISVAFHLQILPALSLARILYTARNGACRIILGGSQISLMTSSQIDQIAALPFVSGVILHEGENSLAEIARQGLSVDFATIPNAVFCDEGAVQRTDWRLPPRMADLPTPQFDEQELLLYPQPPVFPVYVSKGCYWGKCKFCDYTKLYTPGQAKTAGWSTFRPVETLVDDMEKLQSSFGALDFYLVSEAITPSYYKRLANNILDRRFYARMSSYCRVEKGNSYEFFKLLYRAGVRSLTFGVEAANDRVLEVIDKGNTVIQIETTIRSASCAGIYVVFNVIPDYPTTSWEEAQQTIQFVENNIDYIGMINPQFFDLSSNSSINDDLHEHGLKVTSADPVRTDHGVHSIPFQRETGLTTEQITRLQAIYHRLFGDVQCYGRSQDMTRILTHESFKWNAARFVFDPKIQVVDAPFDPTEIGNCLDRLTGAWILMMHRQYRRLVLAPGIMEAAIETTAKQGPRTLQELTLSIADKWEIENHDAVMTLLKQCISNFAELGLMKSIMHPKMPFQNQSQYV